MLLRQRVARPPAGSGLYRAFLAATPGVAVRLALLVVFDLALYRALRRGTPVPGAGRRPALLHGRHSHPFSADEIFSAVSMSICRRLLLI
ncbi:MAG TPA: hypothetical protein VFM11_05410 [Burkholderiales bacterium]|nr:hypothetical protein [Burkholderiales bacterium]